MNQAIDLVAAAAVGHVAAPSARCHDGAIPVGRIFCGFVALTTSIHS